MQSHYIACSAATGRHMEVLKWLCDDQGCDLSELVFESAAEGGSLEILEYLKAQDCPWDKDIILYGEAAIQTETLLL